MMWAEVLLIGSVNGKRITIPACVEREFISESLRSRGRIIEPFRILCAMGTEHLVAAMSIEDILVDYADLRGWEYLQERRG